MDESTRIQIKNRAADQKKEMVRKSVSKNGGKKQVSLRLNFRMLLLCFEYFMLISFAIRSTSMSIYIY